MRHLRNRHPTGSLDDHLWHCDDDYQDALLAHHESVAGDLGPSMPTRYAPGTMGKLLVMALRARLGMPIFLPGDFLPSNDAYGRYIASREQELAHA